MHANLKWIASTWQKMNTGRGMFSVHRLSTRKYIQVNHKKEWNKYWATTMIRLLIKTSFNSYFFNHEQVILVKVQGVYCVMQDCCKWAIDIQKLKMCLLMMISNIENRRWQFSIFTLTLIPPSWGHKRSKTRALCVSLKMFVVNWPTTRRYDFSKHTENYNNTW